MSQPAATRRTVSAERKPGSNSLRGEKQKKNGEIVLENTVKSRTGGAARASCSYSAYTSHSPLTS